jgi:coenzyme F420-reducing hydrogenase gamma subunit
MKVKHFLAQAKSMAKLVGCVHCTQGLSRLHQKLGSVLHDLVQVKHMLALSLEAQRAAIATTWHN